MTELPTRVVTFNALAGMILLKLFEHHPLPVDLIASDFCPVGKETSHSAATDRVADFEIFERTVAWLSAEHYLRYSLSPGLGMHDATFIRTALTEKGMGTLTRPLNALSQRDGKRTVGEQLIGAAKSLADKGGGTILTEATKLEFAHIVSQIFR